MSDGAASSAWTYFRLRAKHWVADVTRVAVGTKCCTLNLKVGILLHEKKKKEMQKLGVSLASWICVNVYDGWNMMLHVSAVHVCFTLMLRLEKCRLRE